MPQQRCKNLESVSIPNNIPIANIFHRCVHISTGNCAIRCLGQAPEMFKMKSYSENADLSGIQTHENFQQLFECVREVSCQLEPSQCDSELGRHPRPDIVTRANTPPAMGQPGAPAPQASPRGEREDRRTRGTPLGGLGNVWY